MRRSVRVGASVGKGLDPRNTARGRRMRLTDDQRRRLAAKGMALGRRLLSRVATIATLDTILRWHRRLIAAKCGLPPGSRSTPSVSLPGQGRARSGDA